MIYPIWHQQVRPGWSALTATHFWLAGIEQRAGVNALHLRQEVAERGLEAERS